MNAQRRRSIVLLTEKLDEIRADLEALKDEEQEAFDNMPESIQTSDKGQAMEEGISYLDDAFSSLEDAINSLGIVE